MTQILAPLVVAYINNTNLVKLHERFGFRSDVLKEAGLKDEIWAEPEFVFDFESIPNAVRGPVGENKRGGAAHDIVSRKRICPGITKSLAADVYFEIMEYCDSIDTMRFKKNPSLPDVVVVPYVKTRDWLRRWIKSTVVRYWPGDFWQKHEMTATCLEIAGIECDPYVTEQKLDALIVKTEQVSADLKDADVKTDQTADMIKKTDQVTADLKEEKEKL